MTKRIQRILVAAMAATLVSTATVPAATAQSAEQNSSQESSQSSEGSSTEGSSTAGTESSSSYSEWLSSGADMMSSGDVTLSAEGSSRFAIDWLIGAVGVTVIGAIVHFAMKFV
ncbi:hypothetical protein [Corynebacterium sp.]|uniref:hypothetical protein n=1 Tax=Corynebacterium sp. TaxID=1720 RepID=UPI0037370122